MEAISTMSVAAERHQVWTFADLQALPEDVDWRRYEIVDGALVVSPSTNFRHESACSGIRWALDSAGRPDFITIGPMAVDLDPTYRIPDILVVDGVLVGQRINPMPADKVLLAVEVVSPGSVTTDRITKPAQYAAIGIRNYWRVETEPEVSLTAYRLEPGTDVYVELGSWGNGETARLEHPFAVEIVLDEVLPPGR